MTIDVSLRHVLARLGVLELRVREAVTRFRAAGFDPEDGFRGLYVSDDDVDAMLGERRRRVAARTPEADALLARIEEEADRWETTGEDLRLRRLTRDAGLVSLDLDLLLVALAPDLDPRYERLYGYLHDDVSRRRASPGLALELAGAELIDPEARGRLAATAPLIASGLLRVEDDERPFLTRSLRLPDRVTGFLLGDDTPDPALADVLRGVPPAGIPGAAPITRGLADGAPLTYVRGGPTSGALVLAVDGAWGWRADPVVVDLGGLHPDDTRRTARLALREARLRSSALVAVVGDDVPPEAVAALDAGWPTVLVGSRSWDPTWTTTVPLVIEPAAPTARDRHTWWEEALDEPVDLAPLTAFRLGPHQIHRAVSAGRRQAGADDRPLAADHLANGARLQNSAGLEHLARRVVPSVGWEDIVLPADTFVELRQLADRVAHRDTVLDDWRLRRGGARGEGISALFAGDSGTGKTMAAEVIAGMLGLELYVINLATVVDKYVGETEKNLEKIFTEAEGINGVLFFDEADALFGKRSEVNDARDRYANVEVAYLLQRMETFDGLAVLATNLKSNVDEAFARRLSVVIDFPQPSAHERLQLWDRCLGVVPRAEDVDLDFCADRFELTGGNIRNIAVTAAYLAASNGGLVHMHELIRATAVEYRKLGRLCVEAEFGPYLEHMTTKH